ncbi:MAG TPA: hypothetical protein VEZ12_11705 [Herpetosiphonaceae bacterium]|nr:hypothetical protein [Herpetosiphonaceae bacterium]
MESTDRIRRAGFSCIAAGVLWTVAAMMQGAYSLQSSSDGVLYYLNEAMYFVAHAGFVLGIFGLIWARAAGNGWFGKIALGLFALGWIVLLVGLPLKVITSNPNLPLFPIGGLATTLGGLLSGIAVAVARRWHGWQRWSVLFYSLFYLSALFLPILIANQEPGTPTLIVWGLAWLPIGYALVSVSSPRAQPATA